METTEELVSYWSFFVERECGARLWEAALANDPRPLVVDIGANAGVFSHFIWSLRHDVQLIAFEPLPKMAARCRAWGQRTMANFTFHEKAVSDHCGTASFYADTDNDVAASLKPNGTKSMQVVVPIVTLDSIISSESRPVLVLKIDVEGLESEVLAGAQETLKKTKYIVIESHTQEALDRITGQLGNEWARQKVGGVDYVFTRNSLK